MASGNMKAIKRRIKSVNSTMQITKAMQLVASSKLRRAKEKAEACRPYFEMQYRLLTEIAESKKDFTSPFTENREVKNRLFIVIAGDRGLAGGYNSNLLKLAAAEEGNLPKPKIIAIGKKAIEYYEKRGYDVVGKYPQLAETAKTAHCADIANIAVNMFKSGEADEVKIFYTTFVSPLVQNPMSMKLLPINKQDDEMGETGDLINYDPSPEAVFNRIVPKFSMSLIYCALTDSYASEQSARRNAMENATDNAEQMTADLSLKYNRARQEKITNEINEIVSGANALQ